MTRGWNTKNILLAWKQDDWKELQWPSKDSRGSPPARYGSILTPFRGFLMAWSPWKPSSSIPHTWISTQGTLVPYFNQWETLTTAIKICTKHTTLHHRPYTTSPCRNYPLQIYHLSWPWEWTTCWTHPLKISQLDHDADCWIIHLFSPSKANFFWVLLL